MGLIEDLNAPWASPSEEVMDELFCSVSGEIEDDDVANVAVGYHVDKNNGLATTTLNSCNIDIFFWDQTTHHGVCWTRGLPLPNTQPIKMRWLFIFRKPKNALRGALWASSSMPTLSYCQITPSIIHMRSRKIIRTNRHPGGPELGTIGDHPIQNSKHQKIPI